MMLAFVLSVGLLAAAPIDPPAAATDNSDNSELKAYQEATTQAERDPDAQIQLALWCEAHGMTSERAEHLARAVIANPKSALAHGLLGMVADRDQWLKPDAVAQKIRNDASLAAALAEYNAKRDSTPNTAEAQWSLALWCDQKGLKPEAVAHASAVTRLSPNHKLAWTYLGYKSHAGRWMTDEQVAAATAESEAQKKADGYWEPRLHKWMRYMNGSDSQRAEAEANLAQIADPRAVPAIWRALGHGDELEQALAVQLLEQINSPTAARRLAALSVFSTSPAVQQDATAALHQRDPRDFFDPLIDSIRNPWSYQTLGSTRPANSTSELIVEGDQFVLKKYYVQAHGAGNTFAVPFGPRSRGGSQANDVRAVQRHNGSVMMVNARVLALLGELTQEDHGQDHQGWKAWWADQQGYSYSPGEAPRKRMIVQTAYVMSNGSCFAAGTLVHTNDGTRLIEDLKVGDVALAQDTNTGALSFQPVVAVYHNPPARTLRIDLAGDVVVATRIHRFWKAGAGWIMARDLKPGDTVRTLDGLAKVVSIAEDAQQPVFNLDVAAGHSYFVGPRGALVHDNTLVESTPEPFDSVPNLAAISARNHGDLAAP